jgi:hypothetical protein
MRYLLIILILSSCSAKWHLKTAIKKDHNILNNQKYKTTVIVTDTIHDTIMVPEHNFEFTMDSIQQAYAKQNDSLVMVYNDSLVSIYMDYDHLAKNFKLKGKVKERLIHHEVIVHDTVSVEVPCPNPILGLTKWEEIQIWTGRILGLLLLILLIVWRLLKK